MSVRTRFAPAPTGALHLGGARTALFSWLVARSAGGEFVIRIEDTDVRRTVPGSEDSLLEDLRWLGLDWDEGPDVGGPYAPYRQSERSALYRAAAERLREAGALYPCYCTPEELAADREVDRAAGRAPRYAGRCRTLTDSQRARLHAEGRKAAWRFAVPQSAIVSFDDAVHGAMRFSTEDIGDFVVLRSDGRATYDLACVVDDAAMDISFVVRGDDHLANTPRQILLAQALGERVPRFAHLPLVIGPEGEPLSKSKGGWAVADLRAEGFLPSAAVEYLASLGWQGPEDLVVRGPADLLAVFDIRSVSPSPSRHDPARLRAIGARHLRRLDARALAEFAGGFVREVPSGIDAEALLAAVRDEAATGGDLARLAVGIVQAPRDPGSLPGPVAEAFGEAVLVPGGEWDPQAATQRLRDVLKERGVSVKDAMHALRRALIGRSDGPPIAQLFAVLGRDEVAARIRAASLTESAATRDSCVPRPDRPRPREA